MIFGKALSDMKFGQSRNQQANCLCVFVANIDLNAEFVDDLSNFILIRHVWAVFTHDPGDDLHQ